MKDFPTFLNDKITAAKLKNINPLCMEGHPRQIRFDGSVGILKDMLTDKKMLLEEWNSFTLISYRYFYAELFGKPNQEWLEIYFMTDKGHVCNMLLRSYSVGNFKEAVVNFFYDNGGKPVDYAQVKFKSKEKEGKDKEGGKTTYHVLEFELSKSTDSHEKGMCQIMENLDVAIYREDTLARTIQQGTFLNYPTNLLPKVEAIKALPDNTIVIEEEEN